ncbi:CheR family methyltransferase [Pedobacter sp. UYEF25]
MKNQETTLPDKIRIDGESHSVDSEQDLFPIIGIGGATGALTALELFFKHMPTKSGMAFVLIIHQDLDDKQNYKECIESFSSIPVKFIEDGMKVAENTIFVAPKNMDVGMHDGFLLLFRASRKKGANMCVDHFFQSLAEDRWNLAVGIVLSGFGADGETGIRMIKEKLGMAMVQEPENAQYPGMPSAAIGTQMADYVLLPEEMPTRLIQYLNHPLLNNSADDGTNAYKSNLVHIQKILMLLRSHTGHDFALYKKNTISRRIERRVAFQQLPDYEHYVNFLRENPTEIDVLFNDLLIGVTKFFRDKQAFDALKEHLYTLLSSKNQQEPIRIWVAGCSTGEEAYSIAILITEYLDTLPGKRKPKAQIFATDLDARAIDVARAGSYFSNIASELTPQQIERFFVKFTSGYVVKKEIREMIVFAQHNLIKDAPFTRLDLICCRNLLIYLTIELQKKIIPIFHYSLNVDGLLFLGPAESVGGFLNVFNTVDSKWKIFERKEGISSLGKLLDFPFNIANQNKLAKIGLSTKINAKSPVAEHFNKILLDHYTPPSLLVNDRGDILYVNGDTGNFIQVHPGEAVMNINRMAKGELKYAIGNALHQAFTTHTKIEVAGINVKDTDKPFIASFSVEYLIDPALSGLLLITFYKKPAAKPATKRANNRNQATNSAVEELEKELIYTKQQLHTTIEQMETSLEELKSTNEELQSTNEEHQSTNEEALTTKEEMQSLNEELMTINLQYQSKGQELTQLNNDMKNLLDNIEIGTIFLDNDLNILRFTPQVTKLFNVISSDLGRSITHIVSNFEYPSIDLAIKGVIATLVGKELEVKTKNNDWYNLRMMPYRTLDNFISGAVLTFTQITPLKSMSAQINGLVSYTQNLIDEFSEATVVLDGEKKILVCNSSFLHLFHFTKAETSELSFLEIINNKWQLSILSEKLSTDSLKEEEFFLQHLFNGIGSLRLHVSINSFATKTDGLPLTVLKFREA